MREGENWGRTRLNDNYGWGGREAALFLFIKLKTFLIIIEDFKASFSRHTDTQDPIDAVVLQQIVPVLQEAADPGRPTPQARTVPAGRERGTGGEGGGEKLEGQTHYYNNKHYRVRTLW